MKTKTKKNPFAALAKPKAAAAKASSIPVIDAPANVTEDVAAWVAADEAYKNASAAKAAAEVAILDVAERERVSASMDAGENIASIRLKAGENTITVTSKCAYSTIPDDAKDDLQEAFGDNYNKYFSESLTIKVRDDADLHALIALVGKDRLADYFDVTSSLKPTAAFHEDRSTDVDVSETAAPFIASGVIRPSKAGVSTYRS